MSASTSTSLSSFFFSSLFLSSSPQPQFPKLSKRKPHHYSSFSVSCQVATLPVLSFTGEKVGETTLDLKSAPPDTARAVVHRGLITDLQNKRRGTASTLTRGEVRGGGRKPFPQKKLGRARAGSIRSPLRPGGGVIFGPKPRDWSIKINKKEKQLAISTALSSAASENMLCVEEFGEKFEKPRTREFIEAMRRWGLDPKEKVMFLVSDLTDNLGLSSRNIGTLRMLTPRTLNLFDILNSDKLVLTPDTVQYLNYMYGVGGDDDEDDDDDDEVAEDAAEEEEGSEAEESSGAD
ncbi:60S ribosomal protein L4 [Turnera subulata]|uniref:Large ribosomal subunit protein uL4c n=1 Tax=Turnera subulata TaxID=218843 RepID=A0A9Q0F7C9_9ROSI|nr:60S ribosomal protein L4 [Turnera subulata]